MSEADRTGCALTDEQRRLVRENIGLVGVHMRRFVRPIAMPRRDREWEDLFQEGCMGLIRAAVAFREDRGIAFAAFALPRIHNAVSRAFQNKFSTVAIPPLPGRSGRDKGDPTEPPAQRRRPTVHNLSDEAEARIPDRAKHDPNEGGDRTYETIGDRLRGKYERAVGHASRALARGSSTRGDRGELVRVLTEERYLVPQEESRTALRQIARQTKSSYARVAQCDKQLGEAVRRALACDPEFEALRRHARADSAGSYAAIDDDLDRRLARISASEFGSRLEKASPDEQARMILSLLQTTQTDMDELVRASVTHLSSDRREALLCNALTPPTKI